MDCRWGVEGLVQTQLTLPMAMTAPAGPRAGADLLRLRPYQEDALAAMDAAFRRGVHRQLIALPTGSGKAVIFAHLLHSRNAQHRGKGLVLVHRDELASQAVDKLRTVNPCAHIGVVKAERDELNSEIIVASVQTLARPKRLQRLQRALARNGGLHTLCVDESHHSVSATWLQVIDGLGAFTNNQLMTVGFTATPERSDGKALNSLWEEVVYQRDILSMVRDGYLCDVRGQIVEIEALDLAHVKKMGRDYQDADLGRALLKADAPQHVLDGFIKYGEDRKFIGFTPTVAVAEEMAFVFQRAGYAVASISGETPIEQRRATLKQFESGQLNGLFNCAVLLEGYDCPSIACVIMARPTKSHVLYCQAIGRGTRPYPGKKDLLVLDVVGASDQHRLVMVTKLGGSLPSGREIKQKPGESLMEAAAREEKEDAGQKAVDGRVIARTTNLFEDLGVHAGEAPTGRSEINWTPLRAGVFALGIGEKSLRIAQGPSGAWEVSLKNGLEKESPTSVLWTGGDMGYAQGFAEEYARNSHAMQFIDRNSPWRLLPASPRQLWLLRKHGYKDVSGITKGDATDAISTIKLREAWGS